MSCMLDALISSSPIRGGPRKLGSESSSLPDTSALREFLALQNSNSGSSSLIHFGDSGEAAAASERMTTTMPGWETTRQQPMPTSPGRFRDTRKRGAPSEFDQPTTRRDRTDQRSPSPSGSPRRF